jgi:hypothetical protein
LLGFGVEKLDFNKKILYALRKEGVMRYKLKQIWKSFKLYVSLPHFWILGIILVLSIISCMISMVCMKSNPFLSSVFANIFAGLITGIVISLISTIKSMTLYRTECLIDWLDSLNKDILEYMRMHRKMVFGRQCDFDNDTFYDHIYNTLCLGNNINVTISQGRFNQSLPFNPYKYVKKKFEYDTTNCSRNNEELREKIIELDVSNVTNNELINLFGDMDRQLKELNGKIIKHIAHLEARKKVINISFL